MDPIEEQAESQPTPSVFANRRLLMAMLAYVVLAAAAGFRLSGRPRLVVWLCLGLFAFRTVLLVLKQRDT